VEGFYSFLGFTRLVSDAAIRKAVVKGVEKGIFGYWSGGVPDLGLDGKYLVALSKVRFGANVAEDEIDLETGFLAMPSAIPLAASTTPPIPGVAPMQPQPGTTTPVGPTPPISPGTQPTPAAPAVQREVTITFTADRNQLFTAWNAVANLADLAGKVKVSLRAESDKGFDKGKLQNGVMEPLREANLIE
jgi:hypothetical protein